jgi:hypothetical protein
VSLSLTIGIRAMVSFCQVSWFDAFGLAMVKECATALGVRVILVCKGLMGQCERDSLVRRRFVVSALVWCPNVYINLFMLDPLGVYLPKNWCQSHG